MMRNRGKSRMLAGLLAAVTVLTASGYFFQRADAAGKIDLNQPCSIYWSIDSEGEFAEDLKTVDVTVNVYKTADVSETRHFTDKEVFDSLDLEELMSDPSAKAEDWQAKAEEAAEIAAEHSEACTRTGVLQNGELTMTGLEVGIYLVVMEQACSEEFEYTFTPYLISLPDNEYFISENPTTDKWVYDVEAAVKAERKNRFGSLEIIKTLQKYQTLLGDAVFVFQVEGVKGDSVYSNVVSLTFSGAGTRSVLLDRIPAGMEVTVTEVYSGASYQAVTETSKTVTIIADNEEGAPVSVEFANTYDEKLIPGTGVTNHFDYDEKEGWQWSTQSGAEKLK